MVSVSFHQNKEDICFIVLNKKEGSGLGFSVAGGTDVQPKSIVVHRVFSQGAASQEGTVSRGDFLLSLNGASLAGLAHGDVLKALHQAQLHKDVLMVIKKGSDQPRPSSRQEPPTANGKGLVSRKTSPLEPGTGKKSVQQLQWPELFVMVLARTALIPLNKKLFLSRCLRSVGRVRSLPSAPLSCSYSSRKPKPFPVPANTLLIRSCHA